MTKLKEKYLLSYDDLKHVAKKYRKKILYSATAFSLAFFLIKASLPIKYVSEGSFKEKGKTPSGINKSITDLFFQSGDHSDDATKALLLSRRIAAHVVDDLDLQGSVTKLKPRFQLIPFDNIFNNIRSEWTWLFGKKSAGLQDFEEEITLTNIAYDGEIPLRYELQVEDADHYTLMNNDGSYQGVFNQPYEDSEASFVIRKSVPQPDSGKYLIFLQPKDLAVKQLLSKIDVTPDKIDKSLLQIAAVSDRRQKAAKMASALMVGYQKYLQEEHKRVAETQMIYLQEKQLEMAARLETMMERYAEGLSSDLSDSGFTTAEKAMEFLAGYQQALKQKLMSIQLEIDRLQSYSQNKEGVSYEGFASVNNPEVIHQVSKEIRRLKGEAKALSHVLKNSGSSVKEGETPQELAGISFETAKDLYLVYSKELNALESQVAQNRFVVTQIPDPQFQVSSLSVLLTDPVSTELIAKAHDAVLKMSDSEIRSQKELDRLRSDLQMHKECLKNHLTQVTSLLEIRQQLCSEKITALQQKTLSLIHEQVHIFEGQLLDYIQSSLINLQHEKHLIEQSLLALRIEMAILPQKWTAEKQIEQQMNVNKNMMEEITKIVELRNISNNLEKIHSAPVDSPTIPTLPKPPYLLLFAIAGALFGAFSSFVWLMAQSVRKGIEANPKNLESCGQTVLGSLTPQLCSGDTKECLDEDLDTLRRTIKFISKDSKSRSVLLLLNQGPNYSENLAEMMAKQGLHPIVLNLCFGADSKSCEGGILQYLENNAPLNIIRHEGYSSLDSGGPCRYSVELLMRPAFASLVEKLQGEFSCVLAFSDAPLRSAEAEGLSGLFSSEIISVGEESLSTLEPYIERSAIKNISYIFYLNNL